MAPDPYWRYVKKIGDYSGGGGSRKWKCNFCGYEKTGSVTRVKDHLARVPCRDTGPCKEVPNDVYAGLEAWRRSRMGMPSCDEKKEEEGTQTATSSQCVGT
ncbi:hypothetical protein KP509_14G097900 [Ceratopteris richardii]|uniref:BED-type domain-containing protein n=1 Tax=Ceratopteris richardii TaxID=49495 RepID=A0A8T2TCL9_CERRI|nr:hypothetical protein KP509_14G097900 [Ceratopteris richardii]